LLVTLQHRSFLGSPIKNNKTSRGLTEMGFYAIVEGWFEKKFSGQTFVFGFLS